MKRVNWLATVVAGIASCAQAQPILFNFDNAPVHAPFPIDVQSAGVVAHLSGTGQSYSIQRADVLGFTPVGFSGNCIYPNSVFAADLIVGFDVTLTDFSILYAVQELDCDSAATMRLTVYMNDVFVATITKVGTVGGTWPTTTLAINAPQGFNKAIVHYESPPPFGCDWGPIFMADNMNVTLMAVPSYTCAASGVCPGTVRIDWSGAEPNRQQGLLFAMSQGNQAIPNGNPCAGTTLGLSGNHLMLVTPPGFFGSGTGSGQFSGRAAPAACHGYVQLITGGTCALSNVAQLP